MNAKRVKAVTRLLPVAAALAMASCASTPQTRIAQNPEIYNALPSPQRALVGQGRVQEGMSKNAVYLAWGSPNSVVESGSSRGSTETWVYNGYLPVWGNGGWGWGAPSWGRCYGWGGYGYSSPSVFWVPYPAGKVTFQDDRVTQWDVTRT